MQQPPKEILERRVGKIRAEVLDCPLSLSRRRDAVHLSNSTTRIVAHAKQVVDDGDAADGTQEGGEGERALNGLDWMSQRKELRYVEKNGKSSSQRASECKLRVSLRFREGRAIT